jgi:hypothetical protein
MCLDGKDNLGYWFLFHLQRIAAAPVDLGTLNVPLPPGELLQQPSSLQEVIHLCLTQGSLCHHCSQYHRYILLGPVLACDLDSSSSCSSVYLLARGSKLGSVCLFVKEEVRFCL